MGRKPVADSERVLVVHYDELLGDSLCYLLSSVRCPARAVDRSELALEIVGSDAVGVVVIDVRMPGIPAVEVARRLKARADVEVIWLTSCLLQTSFDAAVRLGVFDYVEIPFDCDRFVDCVMAAMRKHRWQGGAGIAPFGPYISEILALERQVEEANPIRRWRRRARLAATEAADSLSVDVATLAAWESGRVTPGDLTRIAETIGVADLGREWRAWFAEYRARLPPFMQEAMQLDVSLEGADGSPADIGVQT